MDLRAYRQTIKDYAPEDIVPETETAQKSGRGKYDMLRDIDASRHRGAAPGRLPGGTAL